MPKDFTIADGGIHIHLCLGGWMRVKSFSSHPLQSLHHRLSCARPKIYNGFTLSKLIEIFEWFLEFYFNLVYQDI